MRVFYITSGRDSLSFLDPNIIDGFMQLEKKGVIQLKVFKREENGLKQLLPQITKFKPDVIISLRGRIPYRFLSKIKELKVPIGLWVVDDPYNISNHLKKAKEYDFVITEERSCVEVYEEQGVTCIHLPLAFNPEHYQPMKDLPDKYKSDICFVGTGLPVRITYFDQMASYLKDKNFLIIGKRWEKLKSFKLLKHGIILDNIHPTEVAKYYNGAKIVLNIQRTNNDVGRNPNNYPAYTPNNRTFDIAATKSFQLISSRKDVNEYLELEKQIIDFKNVNDLKNKIDYYLENDELRNKMAEEAYLRTISEHTYANRLEELVEEIKKKMFESVDGDRFLDLETKEDETMGNKRRKSYLISLIKNEADIIEAFVRYHAAIFDGIVLMDNKSSDNTLEILNNLKKEGLPLTVFEDQDGEFTQGEKTTELLKWTFKNTDADFVIPLDADEFLITSKAKGNPREYLRKINLEKVYAIDRINYIPDKSDNKKEKLVLKRLTHYRRGEDEIPSKVTVSRYTFEKYAPTVQNGNHNLHVEGGSKLGKEIYGDLAIAHYPIRTVEQLKSKMIIKWLNKTARLTENIKPAKNSRFFYNLGNMTDDEFYKIAKTFRVRNLATNPFKIVKRPIDLSFCGPLELKYTSDQPTNWLSNLIQNMEQMALDYAKLKQELTQLKKNGNN